MTQQKIEGSMNALLRWLNVRGVVFFAMLLLALCSGIAIWLSQMGRFDLGDVRAVVVFPALLPFIYVARRLRGLSYWEAQIRIFVTVFATFTAVSIGMLFGFLVFRSP
jgi:hypothetical protein